MRALFVAFWGIFLATAATGDILEHHQYMPSSLPSAQGWHFGSNGFLESEIFSIVEGLLVLDSMGAGMDGETYVWYMRGVENSDLQSAVFSMKARVSGYESDASEYYRGAFLGGFPTPLPLVIWDATPTPG